MQAPGFWWTDPARPPWQARLLAPLGALYAGATARRIAQGRPADPGAPVICLGNLVAGGSGKTPAAIAFAARLEARGIVVHVLSRGYGGRVRDPLRVDEARHGAGEVGDEPLLLSAFAPTWVARNRAEGARAAVRDGARAILLDDGFQDPSLVKALSVVVVDAARGFGNGLCIPAGPLREPVAAGLARADLVLAVGSPGDLANFTSVWGDAVRCPVVAGALEPLATGMDWTGQPVLAFAGIADPARFFATLRGLGADVRRTVALDDHQPIPPALLARLRDEARSLGAELVTTEKDAMRLPRNERGGILTLPVRLRIEDWATVDDALDRIGL